MSSKDKEKNTLLLFNTFTLQTSDTRGHPIQTQTNVLF